MTETLLPPGGRVLLRPPSSRYHKFCPSTRNVTTTPDVPRLIHLGLRRSVFFRTPTDSPTRTFGPSFLLGGEFRPKGSKGGPSPPSPSRRGPTSDDPKEVPTPRRSAHPGTQPAGSLDAYNRLFTSLLPGPLKSTPPALYFCLPHRPLLRSGSQGDSDLGHRVFPDSHPTSRTSDTHLSTD